MSVSRWSVCTIAFVLLLIGFRQPMSDVIDYLVFSYVKYDLTITEFLLFFNKDFIFFSLIFLIPVKGFFLLYLLELISKIIIFNAIKKESSYQWGLIWFFFPLTIETSFHLIKQNLATAFFVLAYTHLNKRKKVIFALISSVTHLGSALLFLSLYKGSVLVRTILLILLIPVSLYFFKSSSIEISYISLSVLLLAILIIFKYYDKYLALNLLFVASLFMLKGNNINAVRYIYFVLPFCFIAIGKKIPNYSNRVLTFSVILCIFHVVVISSWNYDLTENLYSFYRAENSLNVIYE